MMIKYEVIAGQEQVDYIRKLSTYSSRGVSQVESATKISMYL